MGKDMLKAGLGGLALVLGYFLIFPLDREYIDVNGERTQVENIFGSAQWASLDLQTDRFFSSCLDVDADAELSRESGCLNVIETASFDWPQIVENAECEIVRPGAHLERVDSRGDYLSIEDFFSQLKCPPEYLGTLQILQYEKLEERGLFTRREVASFSDHEDGAIHIYRYSAGLNTRYAATIRTARGEKLAHLTQTYDDERAEREINPRQISISDDRFTDAIIALGKADARDCGHFVLFENGRAQCDYSRWQISFISQTATRQ